MASVKDLNGKVAVVTGGGRGIGRAIALSLAEAGADVAVVARTSSEIGDVAAQIRGMGRKGSPVTADLTDPGNVDAAIAVIKFEFGQVDILVNNAGGATDRSAMIESSRVESRRLAWCGSLEHRQCLSDDCWSSSIDGRGIEDHQCWLGNGTQRGRGEFVVSGW
jgi:7-alpha-hydroxysteroid dehydrogenase